MVPGTNASLPGREAVRGGIVTLSTAHRIAASSACSVRAARCAADSDGCECSVPYLFNYPIGKNSFMELDRFGSVRPAVRLCPPQHVAFWTDLHSSVLVVHSRILRTP